MFPNLDTFSITNPPSAPCNQYLRTSYLPLQVNKDREPNHAKKKSELGKYLILKI